MNICLCGVQSGYPHKNDCPFPYYANDKDMIIGWGREHRILELRNALGYLLDTYIYEYKINHPEWECDNVDAVIVARKLLELEK